jgi:hypothetical protein
MEIAGFLRVSRPCSVKFDIAGNNLSFGPVGASRALPAGWINSSRNDMAKSNDMAKANDMELTDEDAVATYKTISSIVAELLREGGVQRTPRVDELLVDLSTMVVYALGTQRPKADQH